MSGTSTIRNSCVDIPSIVHSFPRNRDARDIQGEPLPASTIKLAIASFIIHYFGCQARSRFGGHCPRWGRLAFRRIADTKCAQRHSWSLARLRGPMLLSLCKPSISALAGY